ncbi:unnamed protein product [Lathyrus sativus]|nr:unnamed protein product [Lathyrus sativus]
MAVAVMTRKRLRVRMEATSVSINMFLPEELIIEILSRIELSNPLELRCVCKSWKSILVDPQVVESYLQRSFSDILDLTSTAMEHVESFESLNIYVLADLQDDDDGDDDDAKEDGTKSLVNKAAQLDNLLVMIESMKENLKTMKVDMIALKKRMKCFESFLKIFLKTAPSSSVS